jgi:2,3-bisphosphoglycerate-dependent phosphoglycerate mutase
MNTDNQRGRLILIRHQESQWNKEGRWTGSRDIHLTEKGFERSNKVGECIKGLNINIDNAFASMEVRSIETLSCVLNICELYEVPTKHAEDFNERDYGDYTGNNKWEMEKLLGEEDFIKIRRSWDYIPPNGESLKMVYERVIPYFQKEVLPLLNNGKNVLIVGHGNSLRSLLKYIENISDEEITDIEFSFDEVLIFDLDFEGKNINKKTLTLNIK